ncbi:hypothetical protein JW905_12175, partial [bacterium]|nr:hypothetical protein [candidate division CSSED10-310 bacterium]
ALVISLIISLGATAVNPHVPTDFSNPLAQFYPALILAGYFAVTPVSIIFSPAAGALLWMGTILVAAAAATWLALRSPGLELHPGWLILILILVTAYPALVIGIDGTLDCAAHRALGLVFFHNDLYQAAAPHFFTVIQHCRADDMDRALLQRCLSHR